MIKIKKGLDLPINGKPEQSLSSHIPNISTIAVLGPDYHGCKPTMAVQVGDKVKLGQLLFTDKKIDGAKFTAPAAGTVTEINRGERRVLESVVITVDSEEEAIQFKSYQANDIANLDAQVIKEQLSDSGLWTSLRTRPFSKTPAIDSTASSIFVTAIDTNPLTVDPSLFINAHLDSFKTGLSVLSQLAPKVYVCKDERLKIEATSNIEVKTFTGKHPAGNAGTHIHMLDPVSRTKSVWQIGYQDVVAIGKLFETGQLFTERYISVAGPQVSKPQIIKTRRGANLAEVTSGLLQGNNNRIISGSVWNGYKAHDSFNYLGQFHNQVTVIGEGNEREFMGWLKPGSNKFSVIKGFASALTPKKMFNFTATTNGSERAMVPLGQYEALMPLDILPTQLLRALAVGDIVKAMELGCLELDEEDLALCTFACAGKYEYGPILRDNLTRIEKET